MARKKNHNESSPITKADVRQAIKAFGIEAKIAGGDEGNDTPPRFNNFRIPDGVKSSFFAAIESFQHGRFEMAMEEIQDAARGLAAVQRAYFLGSPKYFDPRIEQLKGDLDEDLMSRVMNRRRELEEHIRLVQSSRQASLEKAGRLYQALDQTIEGAKEEQEQRERKRQIREAKLKRQAEEAEIERTRKLQQEREECMARELAKEAEELRLMVGF